MMIQHPPLAPIQAVVGFSYDTEVITRGGIARIGELVDGQQTLLTSNGAWHAALIWSVGIAPLMRVTLRRQGDTKVILAASTQEWFARSEAAVQKSTGHTSYTTESLRPGYRLQYLFGQSLANGGPAPVGVMHGIVFGDGCRGGSHSHVRLCGAKRELLSWFSNHPLTVIDDEQTQVSRLPWFFKELPDLRECRTYLQGWLMGLMATDGSCMASGTVQFTSARQDVIEHVRSACSIVGIGTYAVRNEERISNLTGRPHVMYSLVLMRDTLSADFFLRVRHQRNFVKSGGSAISRRHWYVVSVEPTDCLERVYSVVLPAARAFVLGNNILVAGVSRSQAKAEDKAA